MIETSNNIKQLQDNFEKPNFRRLHDIVLRIYNRRSKYKGSEGQKIDMSKKQSAKWRGTKSRKFIFKERRIFLDYCNLFLLCFDLLSVNDLVANFYFNAAVLITDKRGINYSFDCEHFERV